MIPKNRLSVSPGEILEEEYLKPNNMSLAQASLRFCLDGNVLRGILNGTREITVELAERFAQVIGTTPEFWLNLQRNYDLSHAQR